MKLADLESIQKRLDKKNRKNIEEDHIKILERAMLLINNDEKLEQLDNEFEKKDIKICGLLSTKPKLYVCNVDEDSIAKGNNYTKEFIETFGEDNTLIISADIENQINDLVDNLSEQYKSITDENIEFLYNDIQHQKRNTECGIYSIHFITSMLENNNFEDYIKNIKNDDYMNKYRDFYYIR